MRRGLFGGRCGRERSHIGGRSGAQADERRVFISYSRVDSDFAYRLRADLEASGFETWIDTAKLDDQGGQEWLRLIQDAVDASQAMVVVVSPDSVQSDMSTWNIITPRRRTSSSSRFTIAPRPARPWISHSTSGLISAKARACKDAYQTGLTNLIRSLSKSPTPPRYPDLPQAPLATPLTIAEGADMPSFGPVAPPPPAPPQELATLMTAAYDARGKNDLASEQYFIQQIVAQDPNFLDGRFKQRLEEVTREIEAQRVQRLRALAYEAMQAKQWRRALGAWQALHDMLPNDIEAQAGARQARVARAEEALHEGAVRRGGRDMAGAAQSNPHRYEPAQAGLRAALRARANDAWSRADWTRAAESWVTLSELTPPDPDAQDFLGAIAQNQRGDPLYQSAQRSLSAGNVDGARVTLTDLYRTVAPYYGDPQDLTTKVGLPKPHNLVEENRRPRPAEAARSAAPGRPGRAGSPGGSATSGGDCRAAEADQSSRGAAYGGHR